MSFSNSIKKGFSPLVTTTTTRLLGGYGSSMHNQNRHSSIDNRHLNGRSVNRTTFSRTTFVYNLVRGNDQQPFSSFLSQENDLGRRELKELKRFASSRNNEVKNNVYGSKRSLEEIDPSKVEPWYENYNNKREEKFEGKKKSEKTKTEIPKQGSESSEEVAFFAAKCFVAGAVVTSIIIDEDYRRVAYLIVGAAAFLTIILPSIYIGNKLRGLSDAKQPDLNSVD